MEPPAELAGFYDQHTKLGGVGARDFDAFTGR